jgi:hypothetical protein
MADLSITITNTITPVGIGEKNCWGTMLWNEHWGSQADAWQDVGKGIANTLDLADSIAGKDITHRIDDNNITLSDATGKGTNKAVENDLVFASAIDVVRQSGDWNHIFPLPTEEGTDKLFDGFGQVADGSDNFDEVADGTDNWT